MTFDYQITGIFVLLTGYLLGSIPSGYLAGKWFAGIDLRETGSGSTGATNVLRHVGKVPALGVFLIDVIKGMSPVILAKDIPLSDEWQVAAGLAALLGHIWPIWLKWKGGKAVATGLGMILGLSWPVGIASLAVFITVLSISKIVSLASMIAAISLPLIMIFSFQESIFRPAYFYISLFAMAIVLWRHRTNFKRLLNGTEPKIGQSK